jgi:polysaccharide deacetylase family protein (PEP-CTERM system associated)
MTINALTVDLEESHQATAFADALGPGPRISRVEQNTDRTLAILAEKGCQATFFTVGSVAKQFPRLIRRIADSGHEIACHSFAHRLIYTLSRDQFHDDTLRAKRVLEDAAGIRIYGYRAPSFSITKDSEWAFEVLAELGFTYDSSIFPIKHPNYGMPYAPREPFMVKTPAGSITEFPMPTIGIAGVRAPLAGGAYLRFLPYWFTQWGIRYINSEDRSTCVYLHPWELDPEQPKMNGNITARIRHYSGLRSAEAKFRRLLDDFKFQPLGKFVKGVDRTSAAVSARPMREITMGAVSSHMKSIGRT